MRVVITYNEAAARKKEKRFQKDLGKALAELNQVRWAKVKDPEAKIREVVSPKLPAYLFKTQGSDDKLKVGLNIHSPIPDCYCGRLPGTSRSLVGVQPRVLRCLCREANTLNADRPPVERTFLTIIETGNSN